MPKISITLPNGHTVPVFYVTSKDDAAGQYFNGKRMGLPVENLLLIYRSKVIGLQRALVQEIETDGLHFDTIVCPPSSNDDAHPYFEAIVARWPARDLTGSFRREGELKAHSSATSYLDLANSEFAYIPTGDEPKITSLLIIDDCIASGKSAAAVIEMLQRAGMPVGTPVSIAVCTKMG